MARPLPASARAAARGQRKVSGPKASPAVSTAGARAGFCKRREKRQRKKTSGYAYFVDRVKSTEMQMK